MSQCHNYYLAPHNYDLPKHLFSPYVTDMGFHEFREQQLSQHWFWHKHILFIDILKRFLRVLKSCKHQRPMLSTDTCICIISWPFRFSKQTEIIYAVRKVMTLILYIFLFDYTGGTQLCHMANDYNNKWFWCPIVIYDKIMHYLTEREEPLWWHFRTTYPVPSSIRVLFHCRDWPYS